jgi:predicted RNase H-like HicB family nuclease
MHYHFMIIEDEAGVSAHCVELDGFMAHTDSIESLQQAVNEVFELWFSDLSDYSTIMQPAHMLPHEGGIMAFTVPEHIARELNRFWATQETSNDTATEELIAHLRVTK